MAVAVSLLVTPALSSAASAEEPAAAADESLRRLGVLAVASAISAVGQTPELATPLPFTNTSLAGVLQLEEQLAAGVAANLTGNDLVAGLAAVPGVTNVVQDGNQFSFDYERSVPNHELELVHDDGDLRFGTRSGGSVPSAGTLAVSLATTSPFVVEVDENQPDPLLRVALVSQPTMDLSVDIDSDSVTRFGARQGFTEIDVTGGHYRLSREQEITMRDPDGRSVLTLEDLRYSTLPDLFRITTDTDSDTIDVLFDVALPASLTGGTGRSGTLSIDEDSAPDAVWPSASDADDSDYGAALKQATGLSMVDGLTSLAQYTGTVLALQEAADVPFPNLGGGTSDLFAPGDQLLDLLSTAAAAQIQCGASPENPPSGTAGPGDTVYCAAITPEGISSVSNVDWTTNGGDGSITSEPAGTVGASPTGVVQIDGSDGEPDVSVTFTADGQDLEARSMPHTVQDVVRRIDDPVRRVELVRVTDLRPSRHRRRHRPVQPEQVAVSWQPRHARSAGRPDRTRVGDRRRRTRHDDRDQRVLRRGLRHQDRGTRARGVPRDGADPQR